MKTLTTINYYQNYKGGINNLLICKVVSGFLTIAQFHGKNATKSAERFIKNWESAS